MPGVSTRSTLGVDAKPSSPTPSSPAPAPTPGAKSRFVWPSRSDPRLKLSVVIAALQVLGQATLGFKVSIAQILITIGLCGAIELVLTARRQGIWAWPASGILTGSSIAFILRASGTRPGDWFSLHGIGYFVLAAAVALGSKHLLRSGGRHLFNPSNIGIVATLLVIGPAHVFPQYLWWGPYDSPGVIASFLVIVAGAAWVLRPVRMIAMAAAFLSTFWVAVAILAATGAGFFAIWHSGAVSGATYWAYIAASPEVLIFVFFMMSDPQTAPKDRSGRMLYGALTALVAAGLLGAQPSEFGIKVSILGALVLSCALVPAWRSVLAHRGREVAHGSGVGTKASQRRGTFQRFRVGLGRPVILATLVIAVAVPADTAALVNNTQVVLIERG
ncbi:MAG: hypothetical protein ACRDX8_14045, partial [Acidimicrobiales bacterium]